MAPTKQQIETAAKVVPAVMPIARTIASEKMNERAMRKRKEAELEVIEAKQEYGSGGPAAGAVAEAASEPSESVEEQPDSAFADSIDRMKANEDCELCSRLLEGIKSVDPDDRAVALSEFGRFKQSVDDTEDVDAIRSEIEGMAVLKDVMTREFNMVPSE